MIQRERKTGMEIEAAARFEAGLESRKARFLDYAATFFNGTSDDPMLRLKIEHSLKVLENARYLGAEEGVFTEDSFAGQSLLLAALYHDIGRFEQFTRFHTFSDAHSLNHGRLSCVILKKLGILDDLPQKQRFAVLGAVILHNRFALPGGLAGESRAIAEGVRDADKLDILRVMRAELGPGATPDPAVVLNMKDDPAGHTPKVLADALAGRPVLYSDMRYVNDFRILLGGWPAGLCFAASRRLLARTGHIEAILSGLPDSPALREFRDLALARLHA